MLWGNILGIAIIILQKTFNIIMLYWKMYYVDFVPMSLHGPTSSF